MRGARRAAALESAIRASSLTRAFIDANAQRTQSRCSGWSREAHRGISASTARKYASGGRMSSFAHAQRHCERFAPDAIPPRFCAADCSRSASNRSRGGAR